MKKLIYTLKRYYMNFILDYVTLAIAYTIACAIRMNFGGFVWHPDAFGTYGGVLMVAYLCVAIMTNGYADFARRGFEAEIGHTFMQILLTWAVFVTFLYAVKGAEVYSRLLFFISMALSFFLITIERIVWKVYIFNTGEAVRRWHQLLVVTDSPATYDRYVKEYILPGNYSGVYRIAGILFLHRDGEYRHDFKAEYGIENLKPFMEATGAMEILTDISQDADEQSLIDAALEMNVPVYKSLRESHLPYQDKKIARLGELWVIALYSAKMTLNDRVKRDYLEYLKYREEAKAGK